MKGILLFLALLLTPALVQAQSNNRHLADSLLLRLPKAHEDTNKVKLLDTLGAVFHNINPDSGLIYANWGKMEAEKIGWKKGIGSAHHAIGLNYEAKTQNSDALEHYQKALAIYDEIHDERLYAKVLLSIGNVYTSLAKFQTALEYDSVSLSIFQKIDDQDGQLRALSNIALLYQNINTFDKSRLFFSMALELARRVHNQEELARNLGNLATLYFFEQKLNTALRFYKEAILIYETKVSDPKGLQSNVGNIGELYLEMAKSTPDRGLQKTYLDTSFLYLQKGLRLGKEIQFYEGIIGCHNVLARAWEMKGNYQQALIATRQYYTLKDSIYSADLGLKITKLEAANKREMAERKRQLAELNKSYERLIYISGIILLLAIMGVVVRNFINQIKSNKQLALEKNKHLERIKVQSNVLMDIAYVQSHEVRGPVSTILGLSQLFNYDDLADPVNKELIEGISTLAIRLDKIVTDVVNKENSLINDNPNDEPPVT